MPAVILEKKQHTAWITLNRPESKNILNAEMFVQLRDAWAEVRTDANIRVAVLTGAGDTDFCCGGDLAEVIPLWMGSKQAETDLEKALLADMQIVDKCMLKDEPIYKPIIGAFNGRTLGGGAELLQATDIRIAAKHASFGFPEPKNGICPGAGTMVRLARQIPYAHAMKMLMTAQAIDSQTALEYGLISEVHDAEDLMARAEQLAEQIAGLAPLALGAIKRTVIESHTQPWDEAFAMELQENANIAMSKDAREGPRAFKEKRKPEFKGI